MNLCKMDVKRIILNTSSKFNYYHPEYKDCYKIIYNESKNNKLMPEGICIGNKNKTHKIIYNYSAILLDPELKDNGIQYIRYMTLHEIAHAIIFNKHPEYLKITSNKELYDMYYLHTDEYSVLVRNFCKEFKITRYQDFIYTDDDRDEEQHKRFELDSIDESDLIINEYNEDYYV